MPVYKDSRKGTWAVRYKRKDVNGEWRYIQKRGFTSPKDAAAWERKTRFRRADETDLPFGRFVEEVYLPAIRPRLKPDTAIGKEGAIKRKLIPVFGDKPIRSISRRDILDWQTEMLQAVNPGTGKPYARSYIQSLHSQLSAILNFAKTHYRLPGNPAAEVGNVKAPAKEMGFWTEEEYRRFAEVRMEEPLYYYCFELLFWTGIREGELLALMTSDFNLDAKTLSISKTFYHLKGRDYETSPKTAQGVRTISLPDFLSDEISDYIRLLYNPSPDERIFPTTKGCLQRALARGAKKAGLKPIRIHDLRHSHVSMLLEHGFTPLAVAQRVGHKAIDITYRYAHLSDSVQQDIAHKLSETEKNQED